MTVPPHHTTGPCQSLDPWGGGLKCQQPHGHDGQHTFGQIAWGNEPRATPLNHAIARYDREKLACRIVETLGVDADGEDVCDYFTARAVIDALAELRDA